MTGSGLSCLVILANLCIHNLENISVRDSGLSSSAVVEGKGYQATVLLRTDNIMTPDWSRMNEACTDSACTAYFKHCESKQRGLTCAYYFSRPGEARNTEVEINATDQARLEYVESIFGVIVHTNWTPTEVLFSKFTTKSDGVSPPYCPHRVSQRFCWR